MGTYNPSAPIVLGEEWVGIRNETQTFAPGVETVEIGHRFTTTASRTLADARFYIEDWPPETAEQQTLMFGVYPAGLEDQSGPVKRVVIPCSNAGVTGTTTSIVGASTAQEALFSPSDAKYLRGFVGPVAVPIYVNAYFAVNSYSQALSGKRILGVNVLYSIASFADRVPLVNRPEIIVGLTKNTFSESVEFGRNDSNGELGNLIIRDGDSIGGGTTFHRLPLGTINPFWNASLSPYGTPDRMPWTYPDLQRMEAGGSPRYGVYVLGGNSGDTTLETIVNYLALEVFYCEEKRVAVGGRMFGAPYFSDVSRAYILNTNAATMRDTVGTANPVLAAGQYTLTVSLEDQGIRTGTGYPDLNALRELASIAPHEGVLVKRPFPLDERIIDDEFTATQVHVLPQLSLHTSGGPLTEVHVYGRQAKAPVYGSITATQEILDAPAGGATSFPQVRFYARRFGETTVSLTLDSPSIPASSVAITPTEFDALPEILDGWKEITLRFTTAPSMGTGANPQWRFSAAGETSGNQWQVLGMTAPALSGIPSNLDQPVPTAQQLGAATYGAPSAGTTINLGWMYPLVSATTEDNNSDAALLFSPDPPTVSGFGVEVTTQELSIVDPACFAASCVPTALYYNEVTWTGSVTPVSGFGSYELERYDPVDGDFSLIMKGTDRATVVFNDYEARVGQPSVYRIRQTNLHEFAGLWSPQVTATVTSPGVIGADTALLLFTTNSTQDGSSNLAYSSAWESGTPMEDYIWPEAGTVVLQDMFNKDYPTAFRPLERGGERFARQILVNASGVPTPQTQHGFESLRDMAWADVPYICVRNEDGDRWYSTVIVPTGSVRRMIVMGRLCMAAVQVIEVTDTPFPVDP